VLGLAQKFADPVCGQFYLFASKKPARNRGYHYPAFGVIVFTAASLLKDTVKRIGDLLDDGKPNSSFKG